MKPTILITLLLILQSCTLSELHQEKEAFIDVGGNKIHTKSIGKGQKMILAHGGYMNLDMWNPQIAEFRHTNKIIRFSDLGHGESKSIGDQIFGYEIISELVDDHSDEKSILIGLSWGAMLCIDFVLSYPQKVEKLILVSPGLNGWEYFKDSVANHNFQLRQDAIQHSDTLMAAKLFHKNWVIGPRREAMELDRDFLQSSLNMIHHTMSNHWLEDWSQLDSIKAINRLGEIKVPTYIIIGSEDAEDILLIAEKYKNRIPNAEKIVVENAAHLINMEYPEKFNSILQSILNE